MKTYQGQYYSGIMEKYVFVFFFKQKTAYEIGTGDWSSDVCSSDLVEDWLVELVNSANDDDGFQNPGLGGTPADGEEGDRKRVV